MTRNLKISDEKRVKKKTILNLKFNSKNKQRQEHKGSY